MDELRDRAAVRARERRHRDQRRLSCAWVRLADHARDPVRYVVGKPVGILGTSWLLTRLSRGRLQPPVGWAAVAGGGTIAGIGFTVSLLVATLAFHGTQLDEAKLGILSAALGASIVTWLLFRATELLPRRLRIRALLGTAEQLTDLYIDVDPERDHMRGPIEAPVTVVEYGDFECPYCGQAEPVVRELLRDFADVRYVWRHLPLNDVHPRTRSSPPRQSEAAADQGAFWEMHDLLLDHQDALRPDDLIAYAQQLGLDVERFSDELRMHADAARVAEDVDSADLSGVSGTPTFFINGQRHYGAYDIATLSAAVRAAGARAVLATPPRCASRRHRLSRCWLAHNRTSADRTFVPSPPATAARTQSSRRLRPWVSRTCGGGTAVSG